MATEKDESYVATRLRIVGDGAGRRPMGLWRGEVQRARISSAVIKKLRRLVMYEAQTRPASPIEILDT